MSKKKILVIDDEEDLCELMKLNLEHTGELEVVIAFSGKDGIDRCKQTEFDLVITDFHMPDMNGEQVLDALKQLRPSVPVLLFSIYHDDDSMLSSSVKEKARGIISKPINHDELYKKINEALNK